MFRNFTKHVNFWIMMKTCESFLEKHVNSENWVFYKLNLWPCWFLKWQSCYFQIISALNSWKTFNRHQSSDMEIIIQIKILKLNSLTDRALTWYWNIYCKNSIFVMKKELVPGYQLPGIPGLFMRLFQTVSSIVRLYRKRRNCLGQSNWPV